MSREINIPSQAAAALARGDRIEAIQRIREANHGVDLRAAMEAVEAHLSGGQGLPIGPKQVRDSIGSLEGMPAEAVAALAGGQVIEAIRIVRERTGLGLREAKALVDRHRGEEAHMRDAAAKEKLQDFARRHGVQIPQAAVEALNEGNLLHAVNLVRKTNRLGLGEVRNLLSARSGKPAQQGGTVMREDRRFGWLWMLALVAGIALAYYHFAK